MGIDPAPYWENLSLYIYESKYLQQLISQRSSRAYKFHGTSRFRDDICTINDDGEFSSSYKYTYPMQIELKYQGEQATFFDLNIKIEDEIFIHKFLTKGTSFLSLQSFLTFRHLSFSSSTDHTIHIEIFLYYTLS